MINTAQVLSFYHILEIQSQKTFEVIGVLSDTFIGAWNKTRVSQIYAECEYINSCVKFKSPILELLIIFNSNINSSLYQLVRFRLQSASGTCIYKNLSEITY